MTNLLVVILHDVDRLADLLEAWKSAGIPGVTLFPSVGGFQAEKLVRRSGLAGLLPLLDQGKSQQRTLISLIDEPETLEIAISEADRVVKGFDSPHSGILFSIPISNVLGLQKWGKSPAKEDTPAQDDKVDRSTSNLLKWFEDDVRDVHGESVILDWSDQRNVPVSEIIQILTMQPSIVKVDTPTTEILTQLLANPNVPIACVINNEDRLMGIIQVNSLSDAMMVPVIPEAFIDNPDGYDSALKFANAEGVHLAAEIMDEPIFVYDSDTLENAYQLMKKHKYPGLPVVDKFYRVRGYITMLELLSICFSENRDTGEISDR